MIGMPALEIFDSLCLAILTGFAIRDWRKQVQAAAMPSGYQNCHACGCTSIELFFDPPLPATTAATAWTQTNSVSTATTHTTICAVLQKAG